MKLLISTFGFIVFMIALVVGVEMLEQSKQQPASGTSSRK